MSRLTEKNGSRVRMDLAAIFGDGAFYSLMVGLGETYVSAFALALSAGEIVTGLLAAVPMLAGAVLQLATPWTVRRLGSHRRWVVACAACQAASLLVLPLAVFAGKGAVPLVFLATTLYWAAGLATGPAWNTWVEEIVPKRVRIHFFARRSRAAQLCVLLGFVSGGLLLEWGHLGGELFAAFVALFLAAACCRFVSAACLASQSEPSQGVLVRSHVGLIEVLQRLKGHGGARLLWYLLAVQVAVQIAGPFFAPFMLAQMKLSYLEYMWLIALGFVGKVVALPVWGRLAQRAGAGVLLWIGGVAVVPMSALWMGLWITNDALLYISVIQVCSGIAWGAYELGFFLLFFEAIPRSERTSLLTIYNLGNALALTGGALIGGLWLSLLGEHFDAYLLLFGLSSLARLSTLVLLAGVPTIRFRAVLPAIRTIAVRPADEAAIDRPILPSMPNGVNATEHSTTEKGRGTFRSEDSAR